LYDGVRLRLQAGGNVCSSHPDVWLRGVATVPHSTGVRNEGSLHRLGLHRFLTWWSLPFVGSWNLVFEVGVVATQSSEHFDLYACRQILMSRIPVDVGHYCDAVEKLCGSLILSYRFTTERGILHGVTLPRSWFINLLRSSPPLDKDTIYIPHFVNDTIELLRRIDSQREHYGPLSIGDQQFKYNGSRLSPMCASAYIARM